MDLLAERELDSLLVTDLVNVRYLTGFTGTNGACVVTRDERLFLTDFRYVEQAEEQVRGFEPVQAERDMLADLAGRLSGRAGFEDHQLTVKSFRKIEDKKGESVELVAAGELVESLREVKDDSELSAMRAAAELADEVYESLRERGLAGRTELEVARELERERDRERGAEPSFPPIVAAGAHGARPHAEPRDVEIERDTLVVVDMGREARRLLLGLHAHASPPASSRTRRWRSTSSCSGPRRPASRPPAPAWPAATWTPRRAT